MELLRRELSLKSEKPSAQLVEASVAAEAVAMCGGEGMKEEVSMDVVFARSTWCNRQCPGRCGS